MSYCHQLGPINSTVRLEFHSACKIVMRNHAEQCLPDGAFDPQVQLAASGSGHTVTLNWTSSPAPGVLRYDVYRSASSLDLNPQLVGSSTSTSFADPGRIGTFFYRVRAVRASDQSAYSNEARVEVCAQSAAAFYDAGASAMTPVVGDWNQDGIMDLAIANAVGTGGTVSILLGQGSLGVGNGTFGPPTAFPAGTRPSAIAAGDFNEDGILDLAVANNSTSGRYSILIGQGSGGVGNGAFGAPVSYTIGARPVAIVARDFNEDGILDLAVANNQSSILSVAIGHGTGGVGDGTFAPAVGYAAGSAATGIATGDFNEDGILDLALARSTNGSVGILLGGGAAGKGDGTFAAPANYAAGSNAYAIAAGDFNDDGITDLAVTSNAVPYGVSILLGLGSGGVGDATFAAPVTYTAGNSPADIIAGDFNDDGITDLAVANSESAGKASLLLGRGSAGAGDGTFDPPIPLEVGALPSGLVANDFNEDGDPDLAVVHTANPQNVAVLLAGCSGSIATGLTLRSPNGGEVWPAGTEQSIRWSKSAGIVALNLEVSRDGGSRWEPVALQVTDTTFTWTVTDPPSGSTGALVRIYDATVPGRADTSDMNFVIAPNPPLDAPAPVARELGLSRVFPNPANAGLYVSFALPSTAPATLELLDIAGRRVNARAVGSLGPGSHVVDLAERVRLASGLYFVRLSQGGRTLTARAAVVR
jgi:hypothetical protein